MEDKDLYDELSSIKKMMERSTKFISLSGLSGVMAGVYALIGAGATYILIHKYVLPFSHMPLSHNIGELGVNIDPRIDTLIRILTLIAVVVLILSVGTGILLTVRKAKNGGQTVWNPTSQSMLKNGALPLLTGGFFITMLLSQGYYSLISPSCLIFYGLALAAASQYTYSDVKWLGVTEVILGLLALIMPFLGLLLWAVGFGLMHIIYGTLMYFKYDRESNAE
jgi:hypothetical protein